MDFYVKEKINKDHKIQKCIEKSLRVYIFI